MRRISDWNIQNSVMKTDSEIRAEGMAALVATLGAVGAERFIASLSRERFDYTEWRRRHLPQMSVAELSERASGASKAV